MKKLLYIALVDVYGENAKSDGVSQKINGQCKALLEENWDVWLLAYRGNELVITNYNTNLIQELPSDSKLPRRFSMFDQAKKMVLKIGIDAVYIRYPYADFSFIKMLHTIKKSVKSIYLELPTYPIERWDIQYGVQKFLLSRLDVIFGQLLKKYVCQVRIMGSNTKKVYGIPAKNISNGIDCDEIPVKKEKGSNDAFTIITVSRMNHYHGYDRLIEGVIDYYKNNENTQHIKVIMVGTGIMKESWEKRVIEGNIENYVEFIGAKSKNELVPYFEKANIAIGSIGLHRVNLTEISTLKAREYCARGVPFACSNIEIGFNDDFPFKIQLKPDESPVDIKFIINSYNEIKELFPNYIVDMRNFAEKNLSWNKQMKIKI